MGRIRELPDVRNFDIGPDVVNFEVQMVAYEITGGEQEVQALAIAGTPPVYLQMVRERIRAQEMAPGIWFVTVPYGTRDPNNAVTGQPVPEPQPPSPHSPINGINGPQFSFDTVGETQHIKQSRVTVSKSTNRSQLANADTMNAIGVSSDRVEGCDIHGKKFEWQLDIPYERLSLAYIIGLYHVSGTVNYAQRFAGFEKGEVLYLGASGRFTFENKWNITHRFSCRPNEEDVKIAGAIIPTEGAGGGPAPGGIITIPKVRGWDYVWCEYVTAKVGTRMLQIPSAAYVEEVYPTGDFEIITGGPAKLEQKLGQEGQDPGFFANMSKKIREKVRFRNTQQVIGTVVEWKWSDPNLP